MNSKKHNNGLTLAELLVAMAVGSLVLVILTQGIGSLSKWSQHMRIIQQNSEKITSLFRFIQERLIRIEPLQIEGENGPQVLFAGNKNSIQFVIAETTYPAKPGLYEQSLEISKYQDQNWQIILSRKPLINLDEFGMGPFEQPVILFTSAKRPEFSFFGESGWQQQWDLNQSMPQMIGLTIEGWPKTTVSIPMVFSNVPLRSDEKTNPDER